MSAAPAGEEAWPLSAAATAVLQSEDDHPGYEVLRLALRELLWRRAWRLEPARFPRSGSVLLPGDGEVPALAPLPRLDAVLREAAGANGIGLERAVRRQRGVVRDESEALRGAARDELARRGLVSVTRSRVARVLPRTSVRHTPTGAELSQRAWRHIEAVEAALRAKGRPEELAAALSAAGVLVLLTPAATLEALAALVSMDRPAPAVFVDDDDDPLGLPDFGRLDAVFDGGGGGGGGDGP